MIITRQDAINQNLSYYNTGNPCKHGHVYKRYTKTKRCYACDQIRKARRILKLKTEVFQKLGDKCVNCGFNDQRALQIDHVFGGGTQERKQLKNGKLYRDVLSDKTNKYQILCANCNSIKRIENNESGESPLTRDWSNPTQWG